MRQVALLRCCVWQSAQRDPILVASERYSESSVNFMLFIQLIVVRNAVPPKRLLYIHYLHNGPHVIG